MTDTSTEMVQDAEDSCPAWCDGCDEDGAHVTDYEGVDGTEPDNEALARLMQEGDGC